MNRCLHIVRSRRGEAYIDVSVTLLIVFTFMSSIMMLFPIFTTQMGLNSTVRHLVRTVEVAGRVGPEVQQVLDTTPGVLPDSTNWQATWFDAAEKKIQLKTSFTLTATKQVDITIFRPAAGAPVVIPVTVRSAAQGMSEVYWK